VPVQALFDYIEGGDPLDEFLDDFPDVSREHAIAVLEMARQAAITKVSKAAAEQVWRNAVRALLDNCVPLATGPEHCWSRRSSVIDLDGRT
jgi:hypothetical protein